MVKIKIDKTKIPDKMIVKWAPIQPNYSSAWASKAAHKKLNFKCVWTK